MDPVISNPEPSSSNALANSELGSDHFVMAEDVFTNNTRVENSDHREYPELKNNCLKDLVMGKLTYCKLKYLLKVYCRETSNEVMDCRKRCNRSMKNAKLMANSLFMFDLMFEDVKINVTLDHVYYQRMSDLLSMYIDLELKASETNIESVPVISGRLTTVLQKYLGSQNEFQLDTLLKAHFISRRFQEISSLVISRIVRDLTSTDLSEVSYIRSILVFKHWLYITEDKTERKKILKLASHLVKPPEWLMENPSPLAKEILPCNFKKSHTNVTSYILRVPWSHRQKITHFLSLTRIREKQFRVESCPKSRIADGTEKLENNLLAEIKDLESIHHDLQNAIVSERKEKQLIKVLRNSIYKLNTSELINKRTSSPLHKSVFKSDEIPGKMEEGIKMSELIQTSVEIGVQTSERSEISKNVEIGIQTCEGSAISEHVEIGIQTSELEPCLNSPNINEQQIDQKKMSVSYQNRGSNSQEATEESHRDNLSDNSLQYAKNHELINPNNCNGVIVSAERTSRSVPLASQTASRSEVDQSCLISVRPTASVAKYFEDLPAKATAQWHIPEASGPINFSRSGQINKPPVSLNMESTTPLVVSNEAHQMLGLGPAPSCSLVPTMYFQPIPGMQSNFNPITNSCSNLPRPNETSLLRNNSMTGSSTNQFNSVLDSNFINGSSSTLTDREAILRSRYANESIVIQNSSSVANTTGGCATTMQDFPPLSATNSNTSFINTIVTHGNDQWSNANSFAYLQNKKQHSQTSPLIQKPTNVQHENIRQSSSTPISPLHFDHLAARPVPPKSKTQTVFPFADNPRPSMDYFMNSQLRPPHPVNLLRHRYPPLYCPVSSPDFKNNKAGNSFSVSAPHSYVSPTISSANVPNSNPNAVSNESFSPNLSYIHPPEPWNSFISHNESQPTPKNLSSDTNKVQPLKAPLPPYSTIRRKNPKSDAEMFTVTNNIIIDLGTTDSKSSPVSQPIGPISAPALKELYQPNSCNLKIDLNVALNLLTRNNDLGYVEYNFSKMPIHVEIFKHLLSNVEASENGENSIFTVDGIIELLSQTNENFLNETNVPPPQLLKVNNSDIYKGKTSIPKEQSKWHETTLKKDHLTFISQEKFKTFYSEYKESLHENIVFNSDLHNRCYCLQCSVNNIVLFANHTILKQFRLYQISKAKFSNGRQDAEDNSHNLNVPETSKRSLEMSKEEVESPLPLKKRKSADPLDLIRSNNDIQISYPSKKMISIAELLKDNTINLKNTLVNNNTSLSLVQDLSSSENTERNSIKPIEYYYCGDKSTPDLPKTVLERKSKEPSTQNSTVAISTIGFVPTCCSDSITITPVGTSQNSSFSLEEQYKAAFIKQSSKSKVQVTNKRPVGRPRKNSKQAAENKFLQHY